MTELGGERKGLQGVWLGRTQGRKQRKHVFVFWIIVLFNGKSSNEQICRDFYFINIYTISVE